MHYAILCYHSEAAVENLSQQQDDALMDDLRVVHRELSGEGKLGPTARLMPTSAAVTLRHRGEPLVLDGPFAESKEALLGFYIVECASLEVAIETARRLMAPRIAAGVAGALEIRPIRLLLEAH